MGMRLMAAQSGQRQRTDQADPRHGGQCAETESQHGHADPAARAGISFRGMAGCRFMAHIGDRDSMVETALKEALATLLAACAEALQWLLAIDPVVQLLDRSR
jgi:hypothetical protein